MHQHTGNWPGKTVSNAFGTCEFQDKEFLFVDLPGTYSIMSNSEEEEIARNYICFGKHDVCVVVVDATCLERNLNLVYQVLEITDKVILCVNLLDEAKKKQISIDLNKLSSYLGIPVVGTTARKPKTLKKLIETIYNVCTDKIKCKPKKVTYFPVIEEALSILEPEVSKRNANINSRWICLKLLDGNEKILDSIKENWNINLNNNFLKEKLDLAFDILDKSSINNSNFKDKIVSGIIFDSENICKDVITFKNNDYNERDRKIDKFLTSKKYGIPIMILFLGIIFWITIFRRKCSFSNAI